MKPIAPGRWILLVPLVAALGCEEDPRVVELATEAARRQAAQNELVARQSQQVAEATRTLVEAEAQARKELVVLQKDLQAQQAELGRQRDQLEGQRQALDAQRQQIAAERLWDGRLAAAVTAAGILVACLLPLVFAICLLRALRGDPGQEGELAELLAEELVAARPVLLPPASSGPAGALGYGDPPDPPEGEAEA